jgi:hypothetical protein
MPLVVVTDSCALIWKTIKIKSTEYKFFISTRKRNHLTLQINDFFLFHADFVIFTLTCPHTKI